MSEKSYDFFVKCKNVNWNKKDVEYIIYGTRKMLNIIYMLLGRC